MIFFCITLFSMYCILNCNLNVGALLMWKPTTVGSGVARSSSQLILGLFPFSLLLCVSVDVGLQWQTSRHTCWHCPKQKLQHMWIVFLSNFTSFPSVFPIKTKDTQQTKVGKRLYVVFFVVCIYLTRNLTLTFLSMSIV